MAKQSRKNLSILLDCRAHPVLATTVSRKQLRKEINKFMINLTSYLTSHVREKTGFCKKIEGRKIKTNERSLGSGEAVSVS